MSMIQAASDIAEHPSGLGITSKLFDSFTNLGHIATTRKFAAHNRPRLDDLREISLLLDVPGAALAMAEQKHTDNVAIVSESQIKNTATPVVFPATDAIICSARNVVISVQTADCAPIFLFDPDSGIMAIVHAGWRGTLARIAAKTVTEMKKLGAKPENTVAWLGPMAGRCCYEVSEELIATFQSGFPDIPRDELHHSRHLDLPRLNVNLLIKSGLDPENISNSSICTIHNNSRFYSYRADGGPTGRIISAMVLRG